MIEPQSRTLLMHYEGFHLPMELSWLKEADGSETWTLLDNKDGHRNFDSEAEAEAEFKLRVSRR
jgi:hypothetical protein